MFIFRAENGFVAKHESVQHSKPVSAGALVILTNAHVTGSCRYKTFRVRDVYEDGGNTYFQLDTVGEVAAFKIALSHR